ncbi:8365_t:CDS:2, partial [Ambispora leptoticha]
MLTKSFFSNAVLVLSTAVTFVTADYAISSPSSGVTWNKGQNVQVKWTVTSNTDSTVDVRLVYGNSNNLQFLRNLCSGIDPNAGVCNYVVPGDIKSDINYAIEVGKDPAHYGYSSYFTIVSQGSLSANQGCPNMGGNNCTSTLPCCSSSGYCGATIDYCGTGCDPRYSFNGKCEVPNSVPVINVAMPYAHPTLHAVANITIVAQLTLTVVPAVNQAKVSQANVLFQILARRLLLVRHPNQLANAEIASAHPTLHAVANIIIVAQLTLTVVPAVNQAKVSLANVLLQILARRLLLVRHPNQLANAEIA